MKKKVLVLSSFPAGYRVDVFKGLSIKYDLTVLFGSVSNENRNAQWFVKEDQLAYYDISSEKGAKKSKECFDNLKEFDFILGYDWYQKWALRFEMKAFLLKIPYVINCDGAFINKFHPKDIVKRFFISNASICLAGGKYAREYFLHYGAKAERIHEHKFTSLHNENILPKPLTAEEKIQVRKKLGLSEKRTILSIGQFIHRKGFDILIEAWSKANTLDAQLVIIGGGKLAGDYHKLLQKLGSKNVKIMDFVPFEEIFKYYQAADVFALATREDIWGLIVNESMACGVPVLISDRCVAGLELIQENVTGSIVYGNSVDSWAEKISSYLSYDEKKLFYMGQEAIRCITDFTIENTIALDMDAIAGL